MSEEKSVEERLAALEKKVEELEMKLQDRPTKSDIDQTINFKLKNYAKKTDLPKKR